MKDDDLPPADHIVRYVKPSMVEEDGTANGAEFRLRADRPDDTGLSVHWLEVFDGDRTRQLAAVRRVCRLNVKRNGRFAELSVGAVFEKVTEDLRTLRIVHDPLKPENQFEEDPSHAEIVGLPPGETDQAMMIGDMIAECVTKMHPAIDEV